jgi:hypothetical protein
VAAELPVGTVRTLIGGSIGGASGTPVNLVTCATAPTTVYIAHATGAHQPDAVGRPRSGRGRDQGSEFEPLGSDARRSS